MSALPLIREKESVSVPVVVEFLEEDGVYCDWLATRQKATRLTF